MKKSTNHLTKQLRRLGLHHGFKFHLVELDGRLLLLAVDPRGQSDEEDLPGLKDEAHEQTI